MPRAVTGSVQTRTEGPIGWVLFDHPERRNALDAAMWRAIPEAIERHDADPSVRVIGLRGQGDDAFVSGADISEFRESRSGPEAKLYDRITARAFASIEATNKPVVAVIHGFCIGGGAGIAVCADLRYAADDAVFAVPPARLGLGYSSAGIAKLVEVVGAANARDLLFTARRVTAASAARIGLVHRVVPKIELDAFAHDAMTRIAKNAPLTIAAAKVNLRELSRPAGERDRDAMQASIDRCFESDDYAEGVAAFLDKRSPKFQGR